MTRPHITVLITTFNYGRFIEEAIDSVLSQDFPEDRVQIVVVDDGSTDDTAERVKKYGARVEYFHKPNGGQASALNFGIFRAQADILAFLDADDFFLPGKLARVTEAFAQDPGVGMVYHPYLEWSSEINERRPSSFPLISGDIKKVPNQFAFYHPHPTSCVSFRRATLDPFLPIPETIRMLADAYPVNLVPFVSPIAAIPECLVVYRGHGGNSYLTDEKRLSAEARERRQGQWRTVISSMRKWLSDNGHSESQAPVRRFLDRWMLWLQGDEFILRTPSRFRFFSHLMLYNRCYGPHLSRQVQIINRFNAVGALVLGYKHFHLLERFRLALTTGLKRIFHPFSRDRASRVGF